MKKLISVLLCLALITGVMTGCTQVKTTNDSEKLSIVATIFPEYDWVREILGDKADDVELTLLLDNGIDLHSYQPTAGDIAKIATCDMFIYVGGHSDKWVDAALAQAINKDMVVINLFDVLGDAVKEEEIIEGMEHDHEEDHDHDHHEEEEEHDIEQEAHIHQDDEHVWLSLNNAKVICQEIAYKLCIVDDANAEIYKANVNAYCEKLTKLDNEYRQAVGNASTKTLMFGDRFPFRYLTDDYGLEYFAAFAGCSAESEASFEAIAFLAKKMEDMGLKCILKTEGSDGSIADTIVNSTTQKNAGVLTMDSMQSVTSAHVKNGVSYLSIMENNLAVLKQAMG